MRLVDVDDDVLEHLIAAAMADAAPDEVTPPLTPGALWSAERLAWMRDIHRARRGGLDGPAGETGWAVVVDGAPVGSIRLKRLAEPGVVETGLWLTRSARGRGVGRAAVGEAVARARRLGVVAVVANTTAGNAGALAVLRSLGFVLDPADPEGGVHARLDLVAHGS